MNATLNQLNTILFYNSIPVELRTIILDASSN
jgi:hypothetical protein